MAIPAIAPELRLLLPGEVLAVAAAVVGLAEAGESVTVPRVTVTGPLVGSGELEEIVDKLPRGDTVDFSGAVVVSSGDEVLGAAAAVADASSVIVEAAGGAAVVDIGAFRLALYSAHFTIPIDSRA
jgi:hypothetical protein